MVAAVVGLVLSLVVNPWLLLIGLAAILAAVTYTGGPKPYGYSGLGEVMVLVFFGFVGTVGSAYVQHETIPGAAWLGALAVGLPACGIMLTNNIRDIPTDPSREAHARGADRHARGHGPLHRCVSSGALARGCRVRTACIRGH